MNKTIDPAVLHAIGITLNAEQEAKLVETLQRLLEERIGTSIIERLGTDQAVALEALVEKGDEDEISQWIATNVPNFEQIVQDEYDVLMGEVAQDADKF